MYPLAPRYETASRLTMCSGSAISPSNPVSIMKSTSTGEEIPWSVSLTRGARSITWPRITLGPSPSTDRTVQCERQAQIQAPIRFACKGDDRRRRTAGSLFGLLPISVLKRRSRQHPRGSRHIHHCGPAREATAANRDKFSDPSLRPRCLPASKLALAIPHYWENYTNCGTNRVYVQGGRPSSWRIVSACVERRYVAR